MKNKRHDYAELDTKLDLYMYTGPVWSLTKNHPATYGWRDKRGEGNDGSWEDGDGFGGGCGSGNCEARGRGRGELDRFSGSCTSGGEGTG